MSGDLNRWRHKACLGVKELKNRPNANIREVLKILPWLIETLEVFFFPYKR